MTGYEMDLACGQIAAISGVAPSHKPVGSLASCPSNSTNARSPAILLFKVDYNRVGSVVASRMRSASASTWSQSTASPHALWPPEPIGYTGKRRNHQVINDPSHFEPDSDILVTQLVAYPQLLPSLDDFRGRERLESKISRRSPTLRSPTARTSGARRRRAPNKTSLVVMSLEVPRPQKKPNCGRGEDGTSLSHPGTNLRS